MRASIFHGDFHADAMAARIACSISLFSSKSRTAANTRNTSQNVGGDFTDQHQELRASGANSTINFTSTDHNAFDNASKLAARSLDVAEYVGAQSNALALQTSQLFSGAVERLQARAQEQLGTTVAALNAVKVESSKSTDQRFAELSSSTTKWVIGGAAVLALAFLLIRGGK